MNKTTRTAAAPNDAVSFAPLFGSGDIELRTTQKAVTPFGGIVSFLAWLKQLGFLAAVQSAMPFEYKSPNCIGPAAILSAFLLSVILGARRFAHTGWLRFDRAFHALLGLTRYPGEDAVRGFFHRFTMASIQTFWRPLWVWLLGHLGPAIAVAGYSLDLDSTILQRSGKQQGAAKGYNPGRPGRFSHHPLLAVLAEAPFVLHAWLRSGNTAAGRGVVAFLQEALALLPAGWRLRMLRADSGFFDHQLLSFCEERGLPYLVVARLTGQVKAGARSLTEWTKIDERFCVGEFRRQLQGWHTERRFIVLRERVEEKPSEREAKGRKLIDVPGFTFRIWVTNAPGEAMVLWRDYNQRATALAAHRGAEERSECGRVLHPGVLRDGSGVPGEYFRLQPFGRLPTPGPQAERLSAASHAPGGGVRGRGDSRPKRTDQGGAAGRLLGWARQA